MPSLSLGQIRLFELEAHQLAEAAKAWVSEKNSTRKVLACALGWDITSWRTVRNAWPDYHGPRDDAPSVEAIFEARNILREEAANDARTQA